jgi:ABC-type amino acid transport system permease subunit
MASLIIITIAVTAAGALFGAYLGICSAICREDRRKWSLRSAPTTFSKQAARSLVGISGTRRD